MRIIVLTLLLGACSHASPPSAPPKIGRTTETRPAPPSEARDKQDSDAVAADLGHELAKPTPEIPALLPLAGSKSPLFDAGETRFMHGAGITIIAPCDAKRIVSAEQGPRVYEWRYPGGELNRVVGEVTSKATVIACSGDLALLVREHAELWRGTEVLTRAPIEGAIAATIDGDRAYVVDSAGVVHELSASGARVAWRAAAPGLKAILRKDLMVTAYQNTLAWSTPGGTQQVVLPDRITAIADLGDAIAVADVSDAVRVLTKPAATPPMFTIASAGFEVITALGGDRRWLAIGTHDGFVVQAQRGASRPLSPLHVIDHGMYTSVNAIRVIGDEWLIGGDDQRIHRVPIGAAKYSASPTSTPSTIAFDGSWVVSGDDSLRIRSLDGKVDRVLSPVVQHNGGPRPIVEVGLTASIVWARDDRDSLFRWQRPGLSPMQRIDRIDRAAQLPGERLAVLRRHELATLDLATGAVTPTAVRSDATLPLMVARGDLVAIADELHSDGLIRVIDINAGKQIAEIASPARAMTFDATATRLAIATDQVVRVWSRADGIVRDVGAHESIVKSIAFAPDGRLATGDWLGRVRIWQSGKAAPIRELRNHLGWVMALAWSGTQLASAGADFRIQITELKE